MAPFTRRQFLLASTASAFAATAYQFRYVLSTCLYGQGRIEQILPEVRKTGASALDIWPKKWGAQREQIDEIGHDRFTALLNEHRVSVGVLSRYDLGPFGLGPELPVGRKFGAKAIICGARGPKGLSGDALKSAVRDFAEQMKPHVAAAAEAGLTIGIENHGASLTEHPDSLKWLIEFTPPTIGIALAPYHLEQNPALIASLIRDLGNRIVLFYAWQRGKGLGKDVSPQQVLEQLPGRGPMDFVPIVAALRQIQYAGWVAIFLHTVPGGLPIRESTAAVTAEIRRSRDYLHSSLKRS